MENVLQKAGTVFYKFRELLLNSLKCSLVFVLKRNIYYLLFCLLCVLQLQKHKDEDLSSLLKVSSSASCLTRQYAACIIMTIASAFVTVTYVFTLYF